MTTGSQILTFGPFSLDAASDTLRRQGAEVTLRPQAMRVLKVLAARNGQHMPHTELIRQAWGGVSVSKHNLTVTMGEVKRALGEYSTWIRCHPRLGYCLEVPQTEELVRTGWHHLNRHTREGFEKAVQCFERAAAQGAGARAYEGASRAWILLGAYGMRAPGEVYANFLKQHQRAVELGGLTPRLRSDRALGLHVFERRYAAAELELQLALAEQPQLAEARAALAMLYVSWQRYGDARREIELARQVDGLGPALALSEILVRFCAHDFDAAVEYGEKVLDLHPYFPSAMAFYGSALEALGRWEEALEQYRLVRVLAPGIAWYRALHGTCLAKAGRMAEARALCQELDRLRQTEYVDGYHYSLLWFALGETERAFQELELACAEGCPMLCMLGSDAKFDSMRGDARFQSLLERVAPRA